MRLSYPDFCQENGSWITRLQLNRDESRYIERTGMMLYG
jgi:hypothetical protein